MTYCWDPSTHRDLVAIALAKLKVFYRRSVWLCVCMVMWLEKLSYTTEELLG